MELQSEKNVLNTIKEIVKSVLTAFFVTVILMALLAVVICCTPINEEAVTGCVYVLNYLSVFLAGLFSATKSGKKGFVTGAIAGGLYMLAVYLLGVVLFGGVEFTKETAKTVGFCTLAGMMGGIVGINLSKR